MKKYSSLVKKIEVFEKLATFGSRRAYLQSLADDKEAAKALVNQVRAIANKAEISDESILNGLGNVSLFGKTDPASLRGAAQSASSLMLKISPLAYPEAAKDQNTLMGIAARLNAMAKAQEDEAEPKPEVMDFGVGGNMVVTKPDVIKGYPPIDKADQEAVFDFVVAERIGLPGAVDGKLGKETRQALEAIKNYFAKAHPQNPRMTDKQAITAAKFKGR